MAQNLSNLPIGAKVKFGKHSISGEIAQDIIWLVAARNHTGYPADSITLQTASIIDLRCFDNPESTASGDRQSQGNNRYSVSNIDQWLNSNGSAGSWYSAQHATDAAPTSNDTAYANRPGFLYHLSDSERAAILPTTIRVVKPTKDGGGYEDITRSIFLPSLTEIGLGNENNTPEGNVWEYYTASGVARRTCSITTQVSNYSKSTSKPTAGSGGVWWTRTPSFSSEYNVRVVSINGTLTFEPAYVWMRGVRPAVNVSSTLSVSDTTDSDGCYTVIWNRPPTTPIIIAPDIAYSKPSNTEIAASSSDPDGDEITYRHEYRFDNGSWTTIDMITGPKWDIRLSKTTPGTVQFRAKAIDSNGAESEYGYSDVIPYVVNDPPSISGTDSHLGEKKGGFSQSYSIVDTDSETIDIQEAIDGEVIRSYTATGNVESSVNVTGTTWLKLANGSHTITITAKDAIDTTVRTYTFTKSVNTILVETAQPMPLGTMPVRIKLTVARNIPSAAKFKVEVCNNGYDTNPTWEDCTSSVTGNAAHVFTNTTKTANQWGVKVRVTVERNGGTGACYITSIGGNFE